MLPEVNEDAESGNESCGGDGEADVVDGPSDGVVGDLHLQQDTTPV